MVPSRSRTDPDTDAVTADTYTEDTDKNTNTDIFEFTKTESQDADIHPPKHGHIYYLEEHFPFGQEHSAMVYPHLRKHTHTVPNDIKP